jgi:uncharacterized protein
VLYFDASALVKLAVDEAESIPLIELTDGPPLVSSALARVEVTLAVRRHGPTQMRVVERIFEQLDLIPVDDTTLDAATAYDGPMLRTLDAIHVASAVSLGDELTELITYDRRMAEAATALGLRVATPR